MANIYIRPFKRCTYSAILRLGDCKQRGTPIASMQCVQIDASVVLQLLSQRMQINRTATSTRNVTEGRARYSENDMLALWRHTRSDRRGEGLVGKRAAARQAGGRHMLVGQGTTKEGRARQAANHEPPCNLTSEMRGRAGS